MNDWKTISNNGKHFVLKFRHCVIVEEQLQGHIYLACSQWVFGQMLNEKLDKVRDQRKRKSKGQRQEGKKKDHRRGKKRSRVVHFCNVKSINTEAQKRLLRYSLLSTCLYLPLFFILSFPLPRQSGKRGCNSLMLPTAFTVKLLTGNALKARARHYMHQYAIIKQTQPKTNTV